MSLYLSGSSINEVYLELDQRFNDLNLQEVSSRTGNTKEILHSTLMLSNPRDRWTSVRVPSISPAYSFAELIYVMNGSNSAEVINPWNPALPKFQGNYQYYPGSYGYRMRNTFGFDQLEKTYEALSYNPESRQVLIDIWSPDIDFPKEYGKPSGKDIPCNILAMMKIRNEKLYWTQIMRSNGLYLGLPYDVLLFTTLQEVIAGWLGIEIGEYTHYCDSLHYYVDKKMTVDRRKMATWKVEDLRLDKKESDEVFKDLFKRMTELNTGTYIEDTVLSILRIKSFPDAYENMLMIMCQYMLFRHHKSSDLIRKCYERCSNESYNNLFYEWKRRKINDSN